MWKSGEGIPDRNKNHNEQRYRSNEQHLGSGENYKLSSITRITNTSR